MWTTYSAADEIAQNQDLQATRELSSYQQSQECLPAEAASVGTKRTSTKNVRPASAMTPKQSKAFESDEIDIVNSLKSVEFEPAESVIRAIKDELLKYENSTYE